MPLSRGQNGTCSQDAAVLRAKSIIGWRLELDGFEFIQVRGENGIWRFVLSDIEWHKNSWNVRTESSGFPQFICPLKWPGPGPPALTVFLFLLTLFTVCWRCTICAQLYFSERQNRADEFLSRVPKVAHLIKPLDKDSVSGVKCFFYLKSDYTKEQLKLFHKVLSTFAADIGDSRGQRKQKFHLVKTLHIFIANLQQLQLMWLCFSLFGFPPRMVEGLSNHASHSSQTVSIKNVHISSD